MQKNKPQLKKNFFMRELPWPSGYELRLTREVTGSNPGKSHWWTTGRASGPEMLTAPASPN